ncbi:hypothetical protein ACFL5O_09785 [Myxococcota bacterium]
MSRERHWAARDQEPTRFAAILACLCESTGALGAALVDPVGETVDYSASVDPFAIKVAAAEWRLVLHLLTENGKALGWPGTRELVVRSTFLSFLVATLTEGYALVLIMRRYAGGVSARALGEAVRELSREAGLPSPIQAEIERWEHVQVRASRHDGRRPEAVWFDGSWQEVEILGRYAAPELRFREVAYRGRLGIGLEITLVRERLGRWFVHDLPGR